MNCLQLINKAKTKLGVDSDYALAQKLGIARSSISNYRKGITLFDTIACVKVAHVLGVQPLEVIALVEIERAEKQGKNPTLKFWIDELENIDHSVKLSA